MRIGVSLRPIGYCSYVSSEANAGPPEDACEYYGVSVFDMTHHICLLLKTACTQSSFLCYRFLHNAYVAFCMEYYIIVTVSCKCIA